jgi:predicted nicotinamide N-methyase
MAALRAIAPFSPVAAVDRDGVRFLVDTADRVVAPWTYALGPFASLVMDRALQHLPPIAGRSVLEIGANVGTESVTVLKKHGAGRVIAIEPSPDNARLVRLNAECNDVSDKGDVLALAASNFDGE